MEYLYDFNSYDSKLKNIIAGLFLFVLLFASGSKAQDISVDLILDQRLTEAQTLSLPTLGINMRGRGSRIMNLIIRNSTDRRQENLYFHIEVSAARLGMISIMEQRETPFSLDAGQTVNATNNQLVDGTWDIRERITFRTEMTEAGDRLLERLEGSTRLPNDIYQVKVELYQERNGERRLIDYTIEQIGTAVGGDDLDLSLLNPGGPAGSSVSISSSQPTFRWDGQQGERYRLIVVRDDGQSPETLFQSALSTEPSGSLLDFEMADMIINQSSFNYPISGVQPLQAGEKYFWQIFTLIETSSGTEEQPSEIWEFQIADQGTTARVPMSENVATFLRELLPDGTYQQMEEDGYSLGGMEIDGQQYSGPALIMKIEELMRQNEAGEITIIGR